MTDNIVLEHLKHIRKAVDRNAEDMADLKRRMTTLEASMSSVKGEVAYGDATDNRLQHLIDRLDTRLNLVEIRLELRD